MTAYLIFDTNVYIAVLRDATFATAFRPRYLRDLPHTFFSSVVAQELLAGARTPHHERQARTIYEPFERVRRIVTPTHSIWKEAGTIVAAMFDSTPQLRNKLGQGLLNDILIALSARSIGASVVTSNVEDFRLIQQFRAFSLESLAL